MAWGMVYPRYWKCVCGSYSDGGEISTVQLRLPKPENLATGFRHLEQWQIDGINRLERSGYMSVLRELVRSHTCPFWWFDDSAPLGQSILHNGTICFVNTGTEVLGITALHVYEGYLADKSKVPSLICQMGGVTVEPEKYINRVSKAHDLVSFKLPSVLVGGARVTVHNAAKWPPSKLKKGDLVILGGYPGTRRDEDIGHANFDFVSFVGRITQDSDDHFSIYLDIPNSHWPQGISVGENPNLGGASGGPVFLLRTAPIETIEFAGIVYEYSQQFELVFARHAEQLLVDTR